MTISKRRNRVMIIVWSWIPNESGQPFSEWTISGSKNASDKIIALNELADSNPNAFLTTCINDNLSNSNIFLFLHRSHGYTSGHIQQIFLDHAAQLDTDQELKCFLFGEGNDFIYLAKNPRGLLGTRGTFSANFQNDGLQIDNSSYLDAVLDYEQQVIKKEHFESVWNYYGNAFKAKILELKESLLSHLLPAHYAAIEQEVGFYEALRKPEHRLLLLRLLSFVGKMRKGSDLEEELKKFEITNKKSYLFDDCNAHFKGIYGEEERKIYQLLSNEIKNSILSRKQSSDLISMRNHFDALLKVMPEASFY